MTFALIGYGYEGPFNWFNHSHTDEFDSPQRSIYLSMVFYRKKILKVNKGKGNVFMTALIADMDLTSPHPVFDFLAIHNQTAAPAAPTTA